MKICRQRPVELRMVHWDGTNIQEVRDFAANQSVFYDKCTGMRITVGDGIEFVTVGEMLVKDLHDVVKPYNRHDFDILFELV